MRTSVWRAFVVAAIAVATMAPLGACDEALTSHGPLNLGEDATESYGAFDTGTVVSFGAAFIRHEGSRDATINSSALTPAGKDFGATVTGAYVVDMTGVRETSGLVIGFPPANEAHLTFAPVEGATIKAGTTYQVVFAVRLDRPGEWLFPSYEVRYTIGNQRYRAVGRTALRVCAPGGVACGRAPARPTTGA